MYKLLREWKTEEFLELLNQAEAEGFTTVGFSIAEGTLSKSTFYALLHREEAKKEREIVITGMTGSTATDATVTVVPQ